MIFRKPPAPDAAILRGEIADLKTKVAALQASKDYLKKELMRLASDHEELKRRHDLTISFFEMRVDQIYQNLLRNFPEATTSLSPAANAPAPSPAFEALLFQGRGGVLHPGHIPSPLTLSGFRLDTRRALERMSHVEILAAEPGIAVFGPYRKLLPGGYRIEFGFSHDGAADLFIEVLAWEADDELCVARAVYAGAVRPCEVDFAWPLDIAGRTCEVRIHQRGAAPVNLMDINLVAIE